MPSPSTPAEFLTLLCKSGLVQPERLRDSLRRLGPDAFLPPGPLSEQLVRDGVLTGYQARQLLQGKWRGFLFAGRYRVLELIGKGGVSSVFLCEDLSLERKVAVKVLSSRTAADPSMLARFLREAQAVAALDHPNIVRTHDIDLEGERPFLVLEYVDGSSLQEIVDRHGPMDPGRAAHYVRQAARGLHHLYRAGLVHRDVKPGNLLLDRRGAVKLLDLGLARLSEDQSDGLTQRYDGHAVLGTADYLAPEQALSSHDVDIRADVYGLGATFYFLLAGRPPFAGGSAAQKLLAHQLKEPPSLVALRPDVPQGLAAVVGRMMAKDPARRYPVPAAAAEALAPWTRTPILPPLEEEMPRLDPAAQLVGLHGMVRARAAMNSSLPVDGRPAAVPATEDTDPVIALADTQPWFTLEADHPREPHLPSRKNAASDAASRLS